MPDRLMMYPSTFSLEGDSAEARLLRRARDEYKVILKPITVQSKQGNDRKSLGAVSSDSKHSLCSR